MYTMKRFEIIIAIFGLVLGISGVANGSVGTPVKYDRRDLGDTMGGGGAAAGGAAAGGGGGDINVGTLPGAKGDGATDSTQALQKGFDDACQGGKKLVIPAGIWLHGPLKWTGPCKAPVTVMLQGTLKAKSDPGAFPEGTQINVWRASISMIGGGTIDGSGEVAQKSRKQGDKPLPDSMEIGQAPGVVMEGIKFVNAMGFNLKVIQCDNFKANGLAITAGGETLNTDGIHLARSHGVSITDCQISVGDDCISIGDDTTDTIIRNIQCGPGHGISIGSLGKFPDEKDVKNLEISNVTFIGTSNGARIKTFHNSPAIAVTNVTYSDITIKDVLNPILIDQNYNSGAAPATSGASKVKISGITFKNFKGNTASCEAVSLMCSSTTPCEGITLDGVAFTYSGNSSINRTPGLVTKCENAKASFVGSTVPQCGGAAPGGGGAAPGGGGGAPGGGGAAAAKQVNKGNNKGDGGDGSNNKGGGDKENNKGGGDGRDNKEDGDKENNKGDDDGKNNKRDRDGGHNKGGGDGGHNKKG